MDAQGFALFDTALGRCGVVWGEHGLLSVKLPAASDAQMRARLRARFPQTQELAPPREVSRALDAIKKLLRGEPQALDAIALDMDRVPPFHKQVYTLARTIPPGETLTYGEVAKRLGRPGSARAVGQALGKNPFAIVVPCHRVLAANGKLGGFSAQGGVATKQRMLAIEGAQLALELAREPKPARRKRA